MNFGTPESEHPKTLGQLFQPFTQADCGITRRFGGTGGLAISKQFTKLMGGRIGATSTESIGSTFWFDLPFRRPEAAAS